MHSIKINIIALLCILLHIFSLKFNDNNAINYYGRFYYDSTTSLYSSNWPYSGYKFYVEKQSNNKINVELKFLTNDIECHYYLDVTINCHFYSKYEVSSNISSININLDSNTSDLIHLFDIHKVTESSYSNAKGLMILEDIIITNGDIISEDVAINYNLLTKEPHILSSCYIVNKYKMLIIGDSLTAAYGVDGTDPCSFDASVEDITHSYAIIVANQIHADLHTIAWSGKGVVRNYGDSNQLSIDPMPLYYNRTISTISVNSNDSNEINYWKPSNYLANIVLVMLGSNDYSTTPYPNDNDFINGLVNLLLQIKLDYPNAMKHIAAMCAPSANDHQCINIQQATLLTNTTYIYINPDIYEVIYMYHHRTTCI